ncbi:hypothetical protein EL09_22505 [Salmonella enterica subsp. enterica]|nr:hypothetical protein [Salmonella enterica subsp. enterica]MIF52443.1 hypothetical protein [Salmonella enterica subsp. enterica]
MHTYYSFTEALIRTMAKQQLAAAQWPDDLELRYSLNSCQGDGVSFTGTLSTADLLRLLPMLKARGLLSREVASTLQLFIPLHHATVQLACRSHRYSHSGTVKLVAHDIPEAFEAAETMLLEALNCEYEAICARTEARGYRIIAATYPEETGETLLVRRTANIELRAIVAEPCALGYCDDEEKTLQEYLALIEDGARVPGIEMQVWCNGQLMAQSWIEHVVIRPGTPARAWLHLEEIAYIADEARTVITEQAEAFRSFLRHAA